MLYKFSDEELEHYFSLEGNYYPVFKGNIPEEIKATQSLLDLSNIEHQHIAVRLAYINLEYGKLLNELSNIKEHLS